MYLKKIIELVSLSLSSFVITEINHSRNVVILEDEELGLVVEVLIGSKTLKDAKIIGPYVILLRYEDGSTEEKKILS